MHFYIITYKLREMDDSLIKKQIISLVESIHSAKTGCIIHCEGLNEIITQEPYAFFFLKYLNKIRGEIITIEHEPFTIIVNIFIGILDLIFSHNGKYKKMDSEICHYIIILAQTIYKEEKVDKNLVSECICRHPIWKTKIWWNVILFVLYEEYENKCNGEEKSKMQKYREYMLILSILMTFKFSMISFHCDDMFYIIKDIAKNYEIEEDKIFT